MKKRDITVSEIISRVWTNTKTYEIVDKRLSIEKIEKNVSYISPTFKEIHRSDGSIIIISAPGAVGKTTLARHITQMKKSFYWDLSKLKLGDNSFIGTIAKVFGTKNLSNVLDSINKGEISLFIDAFDEAEIRSGLDGIDKFIEEVYENSKSSPRPNVFFFSRSETAEHLQLKLMDITENDNYSLYEIDYFDNAGAVEFIKHQLADLKDNSYNIHAEPFHTAVNSIFNIISKGINNSPEDPWNDENVRAFIGYAPVLQTVGSYLFKGNYVEIASRFSTDKPSETGISIIFEFINELLDRERKKLVTPLKTELYEKDQNWDQWDSLYSHEDQLITIFKYVTSNEITPYSGVELPNWLINDYNESVKNFLANHPFLKVKDYLSPAFRDYSLAKLLINSETEEMCKKYISSGNFAITQLFARFYQTINNSNCKGDHVGYLYESVSSKKTVDDGILLTFIKKKVDDEYDIEILNPEGNHSDNFSFVCTLNESNNLVFERRLVNAKIEIDSTIILGKSERSIELTDVDIKAKHIVFRANECVFNCYEDDSALYALTEEEENPALSVKKIGDNKLSLLWSNSERYPWTAYHDPALTNENEQCAEEIYALKRILSPFRKHKRKEFAKHSDLIENVIVGSSQTRKKVLNLLIDKQILRKENSLNQFIVDENELNRIGISWSNIKTSSSNQSIIDFLNSNES